MQDKDKIIEGLLKSKIEMMADRNERFAAIESELTQLSVALGEQIDGVVDKIRMIQNV